MPMAAWLSSTKSSLASFLSPRAAPPFIGKTGVTAQGPSGPKSRNGPILL
jgi:hypothetical protein